MPPDRPLSRQRPDIHTSSDGETTPGMGLKSAASARLKMVLFTPIPSASVAIAPIAKMGFRDSDRRAYLKSIIDPRFTRLEENSPGPLEWHVAPGSSRRRERQSSGAASPRQRSSNPAVRRERATSS